MRFIALFVLLSLTACNSPTTPSKESPTPQGSDPVMRGIYPHTDDFKKSHGKFATDYRGQCFGCHGADGSGGTAKTACVKCHNYPHPPGWAMPGAHTEKYLASQDRQKDCLNCHMKESVAKERSCKNCHAPYPHGEDIISDHPDMARTYAGQCTNCHTDFKKHLGDDGCAMCHSGKFEIKFPLDKSALLNYQKAHKRTPSAKSN